ncbi:MAG: hypothetical protein M3O22_08895 [Pseudomonadota bacterium]|nr:hypothetical protein [Pseudomonadota bacterium]
MSQGNNNNDPFMLVLLVTVLLCGLTWAIWHFLGAHILSGLRWVRVGELWVIEQITGSVQLRNLRLLASAQPVVEWPQAAILSKTVMYYMKWFFAALLAGIAIFVTLRAPDTRFRHKYNLETLIRAQSRFWPVISPLLKFNPTQASARFTGQAIPATLPLFAEALSPEEWVAANRISLINNIPDRDSARRACLTQLGARWTGADSLPPYARALLAAFALKIARKRQESDDLLGKIAASWSPEKGLQLPPGVTKEIDAVLGSPGTGGEALKVAERHGWFTTAMLGVLKKARENGGVLASASFLWLRGVDRKLWYALNNLGRQSFHTEAAASMAHFMAETEARRPLAIPRVEPAIDSLVTYFSETRPAVPPLDEGKQGRSKTKN